MGELIFWSDLFEGVATRMYIGKPPNCIKRWVLSLYLLVFYFSFCFFACRFVFTDDWRKSFLFFLLLFFFLFFSCLFFGWWRDGEKMKRWRSKKMNTQRFKVVRQGRYVHCALGMQYIIFFLFCCVYCVWNIKEIQSIYRLPYDS